MNNQTALELVEVLDGSVKNPIERNAIFIIVELILSIVGILMNIFIACIIIFSKPLRTKPRNIFLLGLILSNLSAFVPVFMEFSYFISPNHKLCQVYVAIVGLPYVLFLTNLLLALIDRYVAIVHPLWHMDKVTVRFAFFSQLGASIFISVIYKFAYIAQFIPLNCEMQLIQFRIVGVISLILFSSCIVAQTIVYRRTKEIIKNNKKRRGAAARGTRGISIFPVVVFNLVAQQVITQTITASNVEAESASAPELSVHISDSTINRLEAEATTTLIASVTSLSLVSGPIILFTFVTFICRIYFENQVCSSISWLAPYVKGLVLLHVVHHPIIYFLRSSELSSVAKKWCNKQTLSNLNDRQLL